MNPTDIRRLIDLKYPITRLRNEKVADNKKRTHPGSGRPRKVTVKQSVL